MEIKNLKTKNKQFNEVNEKGVEVFNETEDSNQNDSQWKGTKNIQTVCGTSFLPNIVHFYPIHCY